MYQTVEKGGINFANFSTIIKALRLAWIGRLLSTSDDKWKAIPNYYFRRNGSLLFVEEVRDGNRKEVCEAVETR